MIISCSEKYYTGVKSDSDLHVKLTGSWETIVGENDTFGLSSTWHSQRSVQLMLYLLPRTVHITEYENYGGFDRSSRLIRDSDVCISQLLDL